MGSSGSFAAPSPREPAREGTHLVIVGGAGSEGAPRGDDARDEAGAMRLRRALDVLIAAVALLSLLPVFAAIAILVKSTSRGPVFYLQVRVGRERREDERRVPPEGPQPRGRRRRERRYAGAHGHPFRIVKFRTMLADAETAGPTWSTTDDPRVTSLGRLLRVTRLDETPQFWNVLRGDMSILGPRPERPFFVDQFVQQIPRYRERLRVRPGITGQAQVRLAYDSSIDDVQRKLEQDLDWIEKRSLRGDMVILVRTVTVILTGRGAR
jgi:lipopolysaccharide/colanic/teichoic acid biosynthesis glycosyltransferase